MASFIGVRNLYHKTDATQKNLDVLARRMERLREIDRSIVMGNGVEDSINVTFGVEVMSNGEDGVIVSFMEYSHSGRIFVYYYKNKLIRIKFHEYNSTKLIFQICIGDEKIMVNGQWFDKLTFEEVAFMKDTLAENDYSLSTVAEILKLEKVI